MAPSLGTESMKQTLAPVTGKSPSLAEEEWLLKHAVEHPCGPWIFVQAVGFAALRLGRGRDPDD